MAGQLRVYRQRIRSVQSTKKITKAMELIAASRIVKAQSRMKKARPYADELSHALRELSKDTSLNNAMLTGVENPRRAGILVVTSDRGLAGGYNANAIRCANELARKLEGEGKEIERYLIGRKGASYYNFRRIPVAGSWTGFSEQPNFSDARGATEAVVSALLATSEGTVEGTDSTPGIDELYVVFTRFVNSVTQTATALQLAPVQSADDDREDHGTRDDDAKDATASGSSADDGDDSGLPVVYDYEPEAPELLKALLPRYISSRIFSALLESAASESAARRQAMKSASDNASELIKTYTRLANQARQAAITQELSEIVGGADALASAGSEE